MNTAGSIPDDLFQAADDLANLQGTTRSALYAQAVAEYVARHRHADVTAQLNRVFAKVSSRLPADVRRSQIQIMASADW